MLVRLENTPVLPEELFPLVRVGVRKEDHSFELKGHKLKNSQRYQLFKSKGLKCVCCGLEGKVFYFEKPNGQTTYHLNLYGFFNGKEILFTKDHIIPRAKGGKDQLENYQTMCTVCNGIKESLIKIDIPHITCNLKTKEELEIAYKQLMHSMVVNLLIAYGREKKDYPDVVGRIRKNARILLRLNNIEERSEEER
ncbi:HNH endonuclease [Candidatus Pacearchaeota archaeon]|jgi:5-methylcytosine-specific restriction endonuclease McrA|nr:HNH endonuclease [Candidatus Pacearchaeota archaeon]